MARTPIKTRPNPGVANDRFTGYGMVQPGAHADDHPAMPTPGDFFGGAIKKAKAAQATRDSLANSQDDRRAQLQGERAYYNESPSKTKGVLAYRGGRARG